jgi:predicted secreted Zn-dependent protease
MNTIKPISTRSRRLISEVRDELRDLRQARSHRRALERELSSYRSRTEVDDILAMISDQSDPDADLIREILNRNLHSQRQSAVQLAS